MKIFGILFSLVLFFLVISNSAMVMAAETVPGGNTAVTAVAGDSSYTLTTLLGLATTIVNWFLAFVSIIAIAILIYSGFLFMTAGGEEEKITSARKNLQYGLIGLAVAILAFSVINIVQTFLG